MTASRFTASVAAGGRIIRYLCFLLVFGCEHAQQPVPGIIEVNTSWPPVFGEYHVFYGDLHNHSELSDGMGSPEEAYRYARDEGELDFFSLADHGYGLDEAGWKRMRTVADSFNQDGVFTAFWGFEWSPDLPGDGHSHGHSTVIGTDDYCTVNDTAYDTFSEFYGWVAARNGPAFFNHPNPVETDSMFNRFSDVPIDQFVGMEVWSMNYKHDWYYYNDGLFPDDNNKSCFDEALSRGWKIGPGGGSDNHYATWGTEYGFRMAILAPRLTREAVMAALFARRFYSTTDKNIACSFTVDGYEMGSAVSGTQHTIEAKAFDGDGETFTKVMLFDSDHDTINIWDIDTCVIALSYELTSTSEDYLYIKITQADGDEALSSPVWISSGDQAVGVKREGP